MAKQLSSLDMHFMLHELKQLEGSRVDKIYNLGSDEIYLQMHKSSFGKRILRIINSKSLFFSESKSSDEKPSEFCMLLRKKLENRILDKIIQVEPERILKFSFKGKNEEMSLCMEFFGKGNIILCNNEDIIINSLIRHKFRDRNILPKEKYKWPVMQYNLFNIDKKQVSELLEKSGRDKVVTSLAVSLGLGGIYSEEICLLSKIDKNIDPKDIGEKQVKSILASIKNMLRNKIDSRIVYKDNEAVDVIPFEFESYNGFEQKKFNSFSEAFVHYFDNEIKFLKKESRYEKQISELRRVIEEQETHIKELSEEEKELREKGDLIYQNYALVKEILDELGKASKKYSWKDIKEKLKGHKVIKEINDKDRKALIEV